MVGVETVIVERRAATLDAEKLCGPRLVALERGGWPEVLVYLVEARWGDHIAATSAEATAWAAAADSFLDTVSRHLEALYRAHGGARRNVEVNLRDGSRRWSHLRLPYRMPGWRRRMAERSHIAQREFMAGVERAAQVYQPVREEIERRIEVVRAEQRAEAERQRVAALRMREVAGEVGAARSWVWIDTADGIAFVHRVDAPTAKPAGPRSQPLTAPELDGALRGVLRDRPRLEIEWDPQACAAVEHDCAQRGERMSFVEWWDTVTDRHWRHRASGGRTSTVRTVSTVHATSHHSSHGAGGFDGGSYGTSHGTSF